MAMRCPTCDELLVPSVEVCPTCKELVVFEQVSEYRRIAPFEFRADARCPKCGIIGDYEVNACAP